MNFVLSSSPSSRHRPSTHDDSSSCFLVAPTVTLFVCHRFSHTHSFFTIQDSPPMPHDSQFAWTHLLPSLKNICFLHSFLRGIVPQAHRLGSLPERGPILHCPGLRAMPRFRPGAPVRRAASGRPRILWTGSTRYSARLMVLLRCGGCVDVFGCFLLRLLCFDFDFIVIGGLVTCVAIADFHHWYH